MELLSESRGNAHCKTPKNPRLPTGSVSGHSDTHRAGHDTSKALVTLTTRSSQHATVRSQQAWTTAATLQPNPVPSAGEAQAARHGGVTSKAPWHQQSHPLPFHRRGRSRCRFVEFHTLRSSSNYRRTWVMRSLADRHWVLPLSSVEGCPGRNLWLSHRTLFPNRASYTASSVAGL